MASQVAADHLVIRQVDLVHNRLDTVAIATCRTGASVIGATRTALTDPAKCKPFSPGVARTR